MFFLADVPTVPININVTSGETSQPTSNAAMPTGTNNPTINGGTTKTLPMTSTSTPPPTKKPGRKFDGASFGGGFALAAGLVIIAGILYCVYTRRSKNR